jgi:hypothetical protein
MRAAGTLMPAVDDSGSDDPFQGGRGEAREEIHPVMSSSPTISLFSERPDVSQKPTSFLVSIAIHAVGLSLFSFGFLYTPQIRAPRTPEHLDVRHLELHSIPPHREDASAKLYPEPSKPATPAPPSVKPALKPAVLQVVAKATPGPQTLVQPDLPKQIAQAKPIPVPTTVIWTPQTKPVKNIVAPKPAEPTAADTTPSAERPNMEVTLADVSISAAVQPVKTLLLQATTTSPIQVHGPDKVQLPPVTDSQPTLEPTPTAIMSLSDTRMVDGTATLPPLNESAQKSSQGAVAPGTPGDGSPAGSAGGAGTAQNIAAAKDTADPVTSTTAANGKQLDPAKTASQGADKGIAGPPRISRIALPKDGQFGAVVVGAAIEEQYPEIAGLWGGRLAYTVYLHVGASKSWVLQYSLPGTDEAAAGGSVTHLEPPWPYSIVRPNLAPGTINADALMIEGIVNQAGRFEKLSIIFPQDFPEAQFVLDALAQWQFRPSAQDGVAVSVQVLLIIPEALQ